jgi:hypothetical protein
VAGARATVFHDRSDAPGPNGDLSAADLDALRAQLAADRGAGDRRAGDRWAAAGAAAAPNLFAGAGLAARY